MQIAVSDGIDTISYVTIDDERPVGEPDGLALGHDHILGVFPFDQASRELTLRINRRHGLRVHFTVLGSRFDILIERSGIDCWTWQFEGAGYASSDLTYAIREVLIMLSQDHHAARETPELTRRAV